MLIRSASALSINWPVAAPYAAAGVALLVGLPAPIVSAKTSAKTARQTFATSDYLAPTTASGKPRRT
jgi:hypothetical protein